MQKALKEFPLPLSLTCKKDLEIYINDEGTRTFLAIDLESNEAILNYISAIDSVLKEFALPVYYSPPKLHFSVAWCEGNHPEFMKIIKNDLNYSFVTDFEVNVEQILFKCGNKVYTSS